MPEAGYLIPEAGYLIPEAGYLIPEAGDWFLGLEIPLLTCDA
jgi:hypothetical protein